MRIVGLELADELRPPWLPAGTTVALPLTAAVPALAFDGRAVGSFVDGTRRWSAAVESGGRLHLSFDAERVLASIVHETYLRPRRPLHTYLPLPYHWVPGETRLRIFSRLVGAHAPGADAGGFPTWPVDHAADTLRWLIARADGTAPHPATWPHGRQAAFTVSHDVDTLEGLHVAADVSAFEKQIGVRSCWFIVGEVARAAPALVDALKADGHEVGLHGDRHDNTLAYVSPAAMARRLDACRDVIDRHQMRGFRAPSLLESPALRAALRGRFTYASQVPDTEVRSLIGPRRGCSTVFPFVRHGLLEIPMTLPLEDKLLMCGLDDEGLHAFWHEKAAAVRAMGGVIQVSVHNEPHLLRRSRHAYERLLKELAGDRELWPATLEEIAAVAAPPSA